jgi:hypothetical protein
MQNGTQQYTNVVFGWNGKAGLKIVEQIIAMLLKEEEQAKAAGQ